MENRNDFPSPAFLSAYPNQGSISAIRLKCLHFMI